MFQDWKFTSNLGSSLVLQVKGPVLKERTGPFSGACLKGSLVARNLPKMAPNKDGRCHHEHTKDGFN